ncbi:alpha/beta fold hydrolase [Rhodopirellula bahusiensis]|uniref:Lipase n=1 Tax=Rhodopirellula bahusiensis TaxID=2014065 RepID=A0A2G1WAD9_9BACT|nr:alpha/beta fold hydrolase [Rhodopirellula bahusiensis]PHQ36004.1 lipase [Rhodopirellula bahusiensis]
MNVSNTPTAAFPSTAMVPPMVPSGPARKDRQTVNRIATEQAIVFGSHDHLVGIYHPTTNAVNDKTAVIFVTPGMLHNAGPFRLHVDLARTLGSRGVASLRFDLSGIGESLPVGSSGRSIDRASGEISQAIDWLQEHHGIQQVILFGLCSGADDSIHAAQQDPRVCGIVAMDACGYPTRRFRWNRIRHHYLPRLASPTAWKRLSRRLLGKTSATQWLLQLLPDAPSPNYSTMPMGTDLREFPSRNIAKQEFQRLVDQGCRLHLIYTGGVSEIYNYAEQFFDMLPGVRWKDHATVDFYPEMDHVAILCEDRKKLVDRVTERVVDFAEAS